MKYHLIAFLLMTSFCFTACNGAKKAKSTSTEMMKSTEVAYKLMGEEPFWNVNLNGGEITFERMGEETLVFPATMAKGGGSTKIYETSTMMNGKEKMMKIIIEEKGCQSTMADEYYNYKATVVIGSKTYKGCGEKL